jgi:hypothetical protein
MGGMRDTPEGYGGRRRDPGAKLPRTLGMR